MVVRYCECGVEPALPRRQRGEECWLRGQPPLVRQEWADRRLALVPESLRRARVPEADWPVGRRWCAGCQSFVLLADTAAGGKGSRCRTCESRAGHVSAVKSKYGLDADAYNALFTLQGGRCAICRNRPVKRRFPVDHDHATGDARGLLCTRCNHELLGAAFDRVDILRNAVHYLEHPPLGGSWVSPERRAGGEDPPPF